MLDLWFLLRLEWDGNEINIDSKVGNEIMPLFRETVGIMKSWQAQLQDYYPNDRFVILASFDDGSQMEENEAYQTFTLRFWKTRAGHGTEEDTEYDEPVLKMIVLFNHSILAENSLTEESNQMQEKEMEKLTVHDLLEQHENGTLSDMDFLRALGECEVFTSTPFGELETGGKVLFVVPGPEGIGYYPVFSSVEAGEKYFEGCGRKGYILMQGSL